MAISKQTNCPVCGRPVPPKTSNRGRQKLKHRECLVFDSRLNELIDLLGVMRFAPPVKGKAVNSMTGHAGEVRKRIHEVWRLFTVKRVKTAPTTDDTEYYADWEAQKRARRR